MTIESECPLSAQATLLWEFGLVYRQTNQSGSTELFLDPVCAFPIDSNRIVVLDRGQNQLILVENLGRSPVIHKLYSAPGMQWAMPVDDLIMVAKSNSIAIVNLAGEVLDNLRNPLIPSPSFVGIGRNGTILVVDTKNRSVVELNHYGELVWKLRSDRKILQPRSAKWDKTGTHCFVIDDQGNAIHAFSHSTGKCRRTIDSTSFQADKHGIYSPKHIDFECGRIVIADSYNNRIVEVDDCGKVTWTYGSTVAGSQMNQLWRPTSVVSIGESRFLITDSKNRRVLCVDRAKNLVWQVGEPIVAHTQLRLPRSITHIQNNSYLVADTHNDRLVVLQSELDCAVPIRVPELSLRWPRAAERIGDEIWVSDGGNNRLFVFDYSSPTCKGRSVHLKSRSLVLADPHQVFEGIDGLLYITSTENGIVVAIDKSGRVVADYSDRISFSDPHSAIQCRDGDIVVSDTGNARVVVVSPNRGQHYFIEELSGPDGLSIPLSEPRSCTETPSGELLLLDTGHRRLYCMDKIGRVNWSLGRRGCLIPTRKNAPFYEHGGACFYDPKWVTIGRKKEILIGDTGNNRVLALQISQNIPDFKPLET